MNAGFDTLRGPCGDLTRVPHLLFREDIASVGEDRSRRTILDDDDAAFPAGRPNTASSGRILVTNAAGSTRNGHLSSSPNVEDDAVLAGAPDPQTPSQPDEVRDIALLQVLRNGVTPPSYSTLRSQPSIHGQNAAVGDQNRRIALEDDASVTDTREPLVLVSNGLADSGPPTGIRSVRGRRKDMEDAVCTAHSFLSLPTFSPFSDLHYFAVYDGHGGAQVAMHCRERMHLALAEEIQRGSIPLLFEDREAWESYMKATFLRMDSEVVSRGAGDGTGVEKSNSRGTKRSETVGSTAVVAVLSGYHIIVANCGDSRAVLCRRGRAIALSQDHKPDREDELARIEAAGGRVFNWNGWRVLGVLAMSRAIGDLYLKPYVIPDPDMTMTARSEEDECLILASDGLWDMVSNQDACNFARRLLAANRDAQTIASILAQKAHERGSGDNISVVVVDLRHNAGN